MAQKPSNTPDWIPDDSTGIIVPGGSKQTAGWFKEERPPYQFHNWFWNIVSQFIHYFSSQAEYNVTIDTIANEGDYATLAAYILAGSTPGDRVLVKVDEEITGSTMIIPANISLKFLKGKKLWCDEFALTTVLQFSDGVVTEGDLVLEYCRATGTLPTAVSFNGNDNNHCNIIVKNTSTGTITNAFKVESAKKGNKANGEVINPSGTVTSVLTDSSGVSSNYVTIRASDGNKVYRTYMPGWHGNPARIKLTGSDFTSTEANNPEYLNFSTTAGVRVAGPTADVVAYVAIPVGYKATKVRCYASTTRTVGLYSSNIVNGIIAPIGTGNTTAEVPLSPVMESDDTNYLIVLVSNLNGVVAYGGYVVIEPV